MYDGVSLMPESTLSRKIGTGVERYFFVATGDRSQQYVPAGQSLAQTTAVEYASRSLQSVVCVTSPKGTTVPISLVRRHVGQSTSMCHCKLAYGGPCRGVGACACGLQDTVGMQTVYTVLLLCRKGGKGAMGA